LAEAKLQFSHITVRFMSDRRIIGVGHYVG
jgi:hypothetical protein